MRSDKSLSFTATLLVNGYPIMVLDEATDRPVTVANPRHGRTDPPIVDVSRALGFFSGADEKWQEERDVGLIDFHLIGNTSPTVFYFRHSEGQYRLYVRSGKYLGHGVFSNADGVPLARSIESRDPTLWALRLAHTGETIDLAYMATESPSINLEHSTTGAGLGIYGIGVGHGGYLGENGSIPAAKLRLNILAREVDWLSANE